MVKDECNGISAEDIDWSDFCADWSDFCADWSVFALVAAATHRPAVCLTSKIDINYDIQIHLLLSDIDGQS